MSGPPIRAELIPSQLRTMRNLLLAMVLAAVTLATGWLVMPCVMEIWSWRSAAISASKQRGNTIVAAIVQYHLDNGELPDSLNALVPQYLSSVPPPVAGSRKWIYEQGEGVFILRFEAEGGYPHCYFSSDSAGNGEWLMDD
jgi:hypothetical protein